MATTKVIVVALVALLALQVSGHRIQTVNDDGDDLIEQAAKLLHSVTDVIKKAVDFSTNVLNTLIKDVQSIHDNAQKYAKAIIDAELKLLNSLIDDAKKDTTANVVKVLQCIEDVENELADVQTLILVNVATCSNGSVGELLQDAEQILTSFSQVDQKVDGQADALQKCVGQSAQASCVKVVVNDLITIVNNIPADLKEDISKIETDFKNMEEIVIECVINAIPDFLQKAEALKNAFEKCLG